MEQSDFRKIAEDLLKKKGYARTGCTLLDCTVGGGVGLGFPFGRILNFVGDKSSGKTFLSNEIIAKAFQDIAKRLKWNYDDAESGYTFNTQDMYGVQITNQDTLLSGTVEELDVNVYTFLKKLKEGEKGIYVVDSLDGLANADTLEREEARAKNYAKAKEDGKEVKKDKGTFGMQSQKFLSQEFFRTKADALMGKEVLLIFISQIRDKIDAGMFEKKWVRAGGKALDFYAHSVLVLAQVHKIKKGDRVVGAVVRVKLDKSKTKRPYRTCDFSLYFDYGIDDVGTSLDFLYDLRGDDFKLTKKAESINFYGVDKSIKTYKDFLDQNGAYEKAREAKKEQTGKIALSVEWLDEWIETQKGLKDKAEKYFGQPYSRDELINRTEERDEKGKLTQAAKDLRKEIEIRTIAKWEEIEYNLRTQRGPKYAG